MRKKTLSLALALVMCLGLTVPAFAAGNPGDTTVTDANGVTYQLSNPIIRVEPIAGRNDGKIAYIVPEGTSVIPVSAEGYQLTEKDGFVQFIKSDDDYIVIWSASLGMGLGGSDREGLIIQKDKYESEGKLYPGGFVSDHWVGIDTTQAEVYFISEEPEPTTPVIEVENIPASGTAVASTQTVTVDGKKVEFQMYALIDANGNGTNYIKLRDMAYILNGTKAQFNVGYSNEAGITVTTGQPYAANGSEMSTPFSGDRTYSGGARSIQINGKAVDMTAITLLDDNGGGYSYFKLRDLGKALGFNVGWSAEQGVFIQSDKPYAG